MQTLRTGCSKAEPKKRVMAKI